MSPQKTTPRHSGYPGPESGYLGFADFADWFSPSVRVIILGDSIASNGSTGGFLEYYIMASRGKYTRIQNSGVGGDTMLKIDKRFNRDISPLDADEVWLSAGSNDNPLDDLYKRSFISIIRKIRAMGCRPVVFGPGKKTGAETALNVKSNWERAYCNFQNIEFHNPWDVILDYATGALDPAKVDGLGVHPLPLYAWNAGYNLATRDNLPKFRRDLGTLQTNGDVSQDNWAIDPYNTTGTATLGARWSLNVNGYVTPTKTPAVAPEIGQYQTLTVALPAAAGSNSDATCQSRSVAFAAGAELQTSFELKTSGMTNLSIDVYVQWSDNNSISIGGRQSFHSAIQTNVDGTVSYVLKAPAGAYRCNIQLKFTKVNDGLAASGVASVGMISQRLLPTFP